MNQTERLEEIFRKNENKGIAVAITGSWGVGKTFFWNKFRESYKLKNKYVYVSLFGLESLSDLKTHIYSNIENNHSALEVPRWIRGLPSILKDTRISQFGISASAKVFDSLMFNQVKEAVICFDDFERMSNKLDIKDVMGLANQLKLEKNCQIILILDEDKAEGENKKKYAEYKEKLIDETIRITSVKSLIIENTKDIDEPLIDLMVEFADELEIHNFRFFQKVIKLYKQFLELLIVEKIASSTKERILVHILRGYLIEDFGDIVGLSWELISFDSALERAFSDENTPKILQKLMNISCYFDTADDKWSIQFRNWFAQKESLDSDELSNLAKSELISEKNDHIKEDLNYLMNQWKNLQVDKNYCDLLFEKSYASVKFNSLKSLDFHCFLLKKFGRNDLSKKLKRKVLNWLIQELPNNYEQIWDEAKIFGYKKDNLFHWYIKHWKIQNPLVVLPTLIDVMHRYIEHSRYNQNTDPKVLELATKQDWHKLIFSDIPSDERFKEFDKLKILRKILSQPINVELKPNINNLIFEVLMDEAQASGLERRKNIEYVIKRLKE